MAKINTKIQNKKNFIKQIIKILYPHKPAHSNRATRMTPRTAQLNADRATMAESSWDGVGVLQNMNLELLQTGQKCYQKVFKKEHMLTRE